MNEKGNFVNQNRLKKLMVALIRGHGQHDPLGLRGTVNLIVVGGVCALCILSVLLLLGGRAIWELFYSGPSLKGTLEKLHDA